MPLFPSSASLLSHKLQELCPTSDNIPSSNNYVNPVLSQFPTIEGKSQKSEPRTKVLVRSVPADQASNLIQLCRKHHSTITGAFLAACHFSFTSCLDNTIQISPTATNDITCLTAVGRNHRPNLPEDYVSCHFGSLTYDITLPSRNKDFWQVAQSLTKCIRDDINRDKHLEFLSKIEGDSKRFVKEVLHQGSLKLASRKNSSLTLSNIGQFFAENTPQNLFHPQELIVGTPIHKRFGTFGNYIMGLNGTIHYMICYDSSIISPEIAQRYSDGVLDLLKLQQCMNRENSVNISK